MKKVLLFIPVILLIALITFVIINSKTDNEVLEFNQKKLEEIKKVIPNTKRIVIGYVDTKEKKDDGKYIYYLSPNEDSSKVGICKVKNNGKEEPQELFMEDIDILSINSYKNYIYFIGVGAEVYSESDEVDNKIYRMKKDGFKMSYEEIEMVDEEME